MIFDVDTMNDVLESLEVVFNSFYKIYKILNHLASRSGILSSVLELL